MARPADAYAVKLSKKDREKFFGWLCDELAYALQARDDEIRDSGALDSPRLLRLDDEDARRFAGYTFHVTSAHGYVVGRTKGSRPPVPVHRMILGRAGGKGLVIDHIDGDILNNCRTNLRMVSPHVNSVNRHALNRNNTTGARGVFPRADGRFGAQIREHGRHHFLGYFTTVNEAREARRVAEMKYYGEVCPTNRKDG